MVSNCPMAFLDFFRGSSSYNNLFGTGGATQVRTGRAELFGFAHGLKWGIVVDNVGVIIFCKGMG
jgi:hypothetical protein